MSPPAVRSPTDLIKDRMEALQIRRGVARPLDRGLQVVVRVFVLSELQS
jgi:hypothetical protein